MTLHIKTDIQSRRLYANDASMYEELPLGVAFPSSVAEVRELVREAADESFSITARSAGTSLAGQATGSGVIMDLSRHMADILELNSERRFARVQPGVIRDTLNRAAARHGLFFAPDTATTNRCMLAGMIGNNSCGSFSIKYGTTRDHVLEIETVLSDGSTALFKPMHPEELDHKRSLKTLEGHIYRAMLGLVEKHREQILEAYPHPDIIRRNTGYALDRLCGMQPFDPAGRPFNLAELLCGSEGTLAITTSAKVYLTPVDPVKQVLVPHFETLRAAMEATVEIVREGPAAVELVDHIILNATKGNIEQRRNRFFLNGEPYCILIVQLEGNDPGSVNEKAVRIRRKLMEGGASYAVPHITNPDQIERVWDLRRAGLGLLMGLGAKSRSPSFCEDTAVRVEDLPAYVADFQELLKKYDTKCVFYAHASVGELHLRPAIDLQQPGGIDKMKAMAEEIARLVHTYRGSLSGEHGDGRARAPYIEKVLGSEMMPLLRQVKEIWDPNYLFNPGKIVGPAPIEEDLRYSPAYRKPDVPTVFRWRREGGFGEAVELCNGAGVCRKLVGSGGTMCPSYMATREEKDSTRGRANLFRQLFSGEQQEAFGAEELRDALDLCLSCKACKSECPANVDMARMKAEFMEGWHREKGLTLAERFFGEAGRFYRLARLAPGLSNRFLRSAAGKWFLRLFMHVHPDRTLPGFARQTFREWFGERKRGGKSGKGNPDIERKKVALFVDLFTDHHDPRIGKAAVEVLEALGFEVIVPEISDLGRTRLSKGLVRLAKKLVQSNLPILHSYVEQGIPIVGLEPSEILTLRDEYPDLCDDELLAMAGAVAGRTYQFEEFVLETARDRPVLIGTGGTVYVHGHCHAKALVGMQPMLEALKAFGYDPVDLGTGCCGMAGSFGYEKRHYRVSMEIGELVLFPALRKLEEDVPVCAPGFSCRHQISDGTGRRALHPAELMARVLG